MQLPEEFSKLPEGSSVPHLVRELACDDPSRRDDACDQVSRLDRSKTWHQARQPSWSLIEAEAVAILLAARTIDFPLPQREWKDG